MSDFGFPFRFSINVAFDKGITSVFKLILSLPLLFSLCDCKLEQQKHFFSLSFSHDKNEGMQGADGNPNGMAMDVWRLGKRVRT